MSDSGKAVFLSYASQDAEAAKRICDALRVAGIEVWFDQNELVGGDAWDTKIRKQIKECALLVPIISANTQARAEGYFRLEWRLADQRTHLMGKSKAFLLPVCIDDTRDSAADVPDSFTAVQWTKAPGGAVPPAFVTRVQKLLHPSPEAREVGARPAMAAGSTPTTRRGQRWLLPIAALAMIALGTGLYFALRPDRETELKSTALPSSAPVQSDAGPKAEARKLLAQIWAQISPDQPYRPELELADDLCKRAAELDPANPDVWAAWSQVDSWLVYHNLDSSSARRESARTKAERALRLDSHSYEARLAQACYVVRGTSANGITDDSSAAKAAEQSLRALARERDKDPRPVHMLGILLRNIHRTAEALEVFDRMAVLPGSAAIALNEKSWLFFLNGDMRQAYEQNARSLAIKPFYGNLMGRVQFSLAWTGDLAAVREAIDQIPASLQLEPALLNTMVYAYWTLKDSAGMLRLMNAVPQPWLSSIGFEGPRHYYIGLAHEIDGSPEAAQLAWEEALREVEARLAKEPGSARPLFWKAGLLARLGRRSEAEPIARLAESIAGGPSLQFALGIGDKDRAITLLENTKPFGSRDWTWAELKFRPDFEILRSDPRFQALLARAEADPKRNPNAKPAPQNPGAAAPADKSVAVLAFADLSEKHDSEYFSDGISEELLNVLAKVPGLKVSARTSAFFFKGKDVPIPEVARQLGVAYVVEGSVRRQGDKVRITAQLIKAADGFHAWSDTFTRDLKDIFAVQDEIAGLIAKNLELKIGLVSASVADVDPDAYRLYLEGRKEWNRRTLAGYERAETLLNQAIALDPKFARAHAALADVWNFLWSAKLGLGDYRQRNAPELERILAKSEQALAIDPNCAEAYAARSHTLNLAWRFTEERALLERALELNPNYASAHQWLAANLYTAGFVDEALAEYARASELDPLSHRILDNYSDTLVAAGRMEEALVLLERARALNPTGVQIRCKLTILLGRLGRRAEALAAARNLVADPETEEAPYRYQAAIDALVTFNQATEAEALLARIPAGTAERVTALLALGHYPEALPDLDHLNIGFLEEIRTDPLYATFRAMPEFQAWLGRTGLAEAQARLDRWIAASRQLKR